MGAANRRGVCPACGAREFVGGVCDRVLQLSGGGAVREAPGAEPGATREEGGRTGRPRRARPPYVHQIPLRYVPGVGPAVVRRLIAAFGTELRVLHEVEEEDLASVVGPRLAARLAAARRGTAALDIVPGAGGRYGRVRPPT